MNSAEHTINLDAPWEPRTFAVGERVRVRLSPECQVSGASRGFFTGIVVTAGPTGHHPATNGAVGTVIPTPRWLNERLQALMASDGHCYCVEFDSVILTADGRRLRGGRYAGAELESLEDSRG